MVYAKKIFCVVAYDIQENKKRIQIFKLLKKYGVRKNLSVFECIFTATQLDKVKESVAKVIDPKTDTVIYYPICVNCFTKISYLPNRNKAPKLVKMI